MKLKTRWLEPRQRILQRHGKRLSIQLEREFWDQLEVCAKDQGIKLSELVFELVAENPDMNRSSLLRTYCARWMRNKLLRAHLTSSNADIQALLTACPMPCVVITREKKLVAQNGAFSDKILGSLVAPDQWEDADNIIRFSLGKPIDRIIRDLTDGSAQYVETNVAFTRGSAIVQMIGRFCLLHQRSSTASPLLCYLDLQRARG